EREKLHAAMPILKDPEKGPKVMKAIRDFARDSLGFSERELDQAYDSRIILLADMARRWADHAKSLQAAKAKRAKDPNPPDPGAKKPPMTRNAKREADRKAAEKRLEKSGKVEDALALILK